MKVLVNHPSVGMPLAPPLLSTTLDASLRLEEIDRLKLFYGTTKRAMTWAIVVVAISCIGLGAMLYKSEAASSKLRDEMERDFNLRLQSYARKIQEQSAGIALATPDQIELNEKYQTGRVVGRTGRYFEAESAGSEKVTAGRILVEPGALLNSTKKPADPSGDEVMLVHEGEGEISVGGKVIQARPGSVVFVPSSVNPQIRNIGQVPLRIEYVRWIPRQAQGRREVFLTKGNK